MVHRSSSRSSARAKKETTDEVDMQKHTIGVCLGLLVGLPAVAGAAWYRSYGFGALLPLAAAHEIPLEDNTLMPLSSLTQVEVTIDNQSASAATTWGEARCCYKSKDLVASPASGCGAVVAGATGQGNKKITISGTNVTNCKGTASNVPFISLGAGTGADTKLMYLTNVRTNGT
jgi:hypothetical protein